MIISEDTGDIARSATDAKRLVIEIVSTLAHVKKEAAQRILLPAGVPKDLITRFLKERNQLTNDKLSKREAAGIILDELDRGSPDTGAKVAREIIKIAVNWNDFHLAQDEYRARATVQKAREMQGQLIEHDARERAEHERRVEQAAQRQRREAGALIVQKSPLLLAQFEAAMKDDTDPHQRGYLLQDLLNQLYTIHGLPVMRAFQRNQGAEQIDGAYEMNGWHYIVECRWRQQLPNIRELHGLSGQVARSGRQTMGLFLSINGWSQNVIPLLKQNGDKSIFLMDGVDLHAVLAQQISLKNLLKGKLSALNLKTEPFASVRDLLN
jgi:hypothetical protein